MLLRKWEVPEFGVGTAGVVDVADTVVHIDTAAELPVVADVGSEAAVIKTTRRQAELGSEVE